MASTWALIRSDLASDRRNPKGLFLCVLYRIAHSCVEWPNVMKPMAVLVILLYKLLTEYVLGSEIHWRATIGPSLRVYHGYGLVIHSNAIIGSNFTVRHGVTIGSKDEMGTQTPIIGDRVNVGASALIIGSHKLGDDVVVGAGAVVVGDVPAGSIVVGNPGRILSRE